MCEREDARDSEDARVVLMGEENRCCQYHQLSSLRKIRTRVLDPEKYCHCAAAQVFGIHFGPPGVCASAFLSVVPILCQDSSGRERERSRASEEGVELGKRVEGEGDVEGPQLDSCPFCESVRL